MKAGQGTALMLLGGLSEPSLPQQGLCRPSLSMLIQTFVLLLHGFMLWITVFGYNVETSLRGHLYRRLLCGGWAGFKLCSCLGGLNARNWYIIFVCLLALFPSLPSLPSSLIIYRRNERPVEYHRFRFTPWMSKLVLISQWISAVVYGRVQ